MTRRATFDGAHQEQALRRLLTWSRRALRTRSGKGLRDVAAELGMSPASLARYLNGSVPLSSEQFAPFAAAFETTEAELIAACLPAVREREGQRQDERAHLLAAGYDPGEVEAALAQAAALDPDARAGWLSYQVHKRNPSVAQDAPPPRSPRRTTSAAG